jgi:transposase
MIGATVHAYLGIDISKDKFDVTLLTRQKTYHKEFDNTPHGFEDLRKFLGRYTSDPLHACMEATGRYGEGLAQFLFEAGAEVSVVNPARIKAYGASKLRRNKTDKADSALIAQYCQKEEPASWSPAPESFTALQALTRRLDDLQEILLMERNRLSAGEKNTQVAASLTEHLKILEGMIADTKSSIQSHINQNPGLKRDQDLLVSIPGIGKLTAAKILGEVRDIHEFESARQLAAYAGLTPKNCTSGTSVHKKARMSKTGNINLRKALYMSAISAKNYNPIIQAFCHRLLARGLCKMAVVGAAMRKLLHLAYGILKSGMPFDPDFLLKQQIAS